MTPEQRTLRGRIGGHRRAALYDGELMTATARQVYRSSFLDGHGPCAACGPARVTIPTELPDTERGRRARKLRAAHYAAMAYKSAMSRTKRKAPAPLKADARGSNRDVITTDHRPAA